MKRLQRLTAVAIGLVVGHGAARAQSAPALPQTAGPPGFGMPMMQRGCCAMHMGRQAQLNPPTGLQALQQAFSLLHRLDSQLQKSQIKGSAVRVLRDDVKAMQQAGQAKNSTLAQRKDKTLQVLQTSLTDLQNLLDDPQLPATARKPLSDVLQQLQLLYQRAQ
jgi:hypothetical protein